MPESASDFLNQVEVLGLLERVNSAVGKDGRGVQIACSISILQRHCITLFAIDLL